MPIYTYIDGQGVSNWAIFYSAHKEHAIRVPLSHFSLPEMFGLVTITILCNELWPNTWDFAKTWFLTQVRSVRVLFYELPI